jgi:predicted alpha/beta hydrolase family esterase
MKILYLHGLKSSPNSWKRQQLEEMGHEVFAPKLDPKNWELSVLTAREYIDMVEPDVIIGSSRGGAVAIAAGTTKPLVLLAPAWGKYCPWGTISSNTIIIHSKKDKVVPYSDSELLSKSFGVKLVEAGTSHRMNEKEVIEKLKCVINYWDL